MATARRRAGQGVRVSGRDFKTVRTSSTKNVKGAVEGVTAFTPTDIKRQEIENQESKPLIKSEDKKVEEIKVENKKIEASGSIEPYKFTLSEKIARQQQILERSGNPFSVIPIVALSFAKTTSDTFEFGKQIITKPKETGLAIGGGILKIAKDPIGSINNLVGQSRVNANITPLSTTSNFVADITTSIKIGQGVSKVSSEVSSLSKVTKAKLSNNFFGVEDDIIKNIKTSSKNVDIKLVNIEEAKLPLKEQVKFEGTEGVRVSAQKSFFTPIKRRTEVLVDKPKLSPSDSDLEKSTFFEPRPFLRESRLGLNQKTAGVLDFVSGDITFRKTKPQILIDPKGKVEKFPSSLRSVKIKLSQGKSLSKKEQQKLSEFQLKPSGQFKPIGFLSTESEITVAPNEIIQKQKKLGVTRIKGQAVDIFEIKIKQQPNILTNRIISNFDELRQGSSRSTLRPRTSPIGFVSSIYSPNKSLLSKSLSFSKSKTSISSNTFNPSNNQNPIIFNPSSSFSSKSKSNSINNLNSFSSIGKANKILKSIPTIKPTLKLENSIFKNKKQKKITSKQSKKFRPTLFTSTFEIKGSRDIIGETSGLGLRPITTKRL